MVDSYKSIKEIKQYAEENNVPIMQEEGIDFIITFIIKHQIKSILEIGTAIGYSAIMMALANPDIKITTIEKDEKRYLEALKNVKKLELENRITLIFNEAENVILEGEFDMLLIDAAKAQNKRFFELFEHNVKVGGFILTDNMFFHGLVEKEESEITSRNVLGIVRKIKQYATFLEKNPSFETNIYRAGDGIAVSKKIEDS
ncbi:MAG TPA: O-methyltransferase [Candidatus Onthousia faecigallinarum]|nr:O-methyltransferase [Candidatus Onthousia faecigallinarum]